jgi:3-hydroxyacyl-[acyl-carrier-protein] dehydratase
VISTAAGIRQALPHRYPMLLIDQITEVAARRLVAVKAVTCNEPWYQHLPDMPGPGSYDYPAVLVIESWCQAAALLAAHRPEQPGRAAGQVMLFGALSRAVIAAPVRPGDVLEHRVRQVRAFDGAVIFEGESLVRQVAVLTVGQLMIAWRPAAEVAATIGCAAAGDRA